MFEANVLGTIAVTKAVAAAHAGGRAADGSSPSRRWAGGSPTFGLGVYCASKFAQEGFGEALALELAPFEGLHAVIIEPGIIKTERWDEHRGTAAGALDPLEPLLRAVPGQRGGRRRVSSSARRTRPEDVAAAIHEALTADRPKMRYVVGRRRRGGHRAAPLPAVGAVRAAVLRGQFLRRDAARGAQPPPPRRARVSRLPGHLLAVHRPRARPAGIAEALRERGHDVAFYSRPSAARGCSRPRASRCSSSSAWTSGAASTACGRSSPPTPARARARPSCGAPCATGSSETIPDQLADLDAGCSARWRPGRARHRPLPVGPDHGALGEDRHSRSRCPRRSWGR